MLTLNDKVVPKRKFPAGELICNIDGMYNKSRQDAWLELIYEDSDDLVLLQLVVNALTHINVDVRMHLKMPYFPYSRQDRVCNPGDSFSAEVVAGIINSLQLESVVTYDDHSNVPSLLLNRHREVGQLQCVSQNIPLMHAINTSLDPILVSPDAGAMKKVFGIGSALQLEQVCASKIRDTATGEILRTEVGSVEGRDCFILDDICDGGRTFIELAKALRAKGARSVFLYVTHGIFSKGTEVFDGLIDGIFSTPSMPTLYKGVFYHENGNLLATADTYRRS